MCSRRRVSGLAEILLFLLCSDAIGAPFGNFDTEPFQPECEYTIKVFTPVVDYSVLPERIERSVEVREVTAFKVIPKHIKFNVLFRQADLCDKIKHIIYPNSLKPDSVEKEIIHCNFEKQDRNKKVPVTFEIRAEDKNKAVPDDDRINLPKWENLTYEGDPYHPTEGLFSIVENCNKESTPSPPSGNLVTPVIPLRDVIASQNLSPITRDPVYIGSVIIR